MKGNLYFSGITLFAMPITKVLFLAQGFSAGQQNGSGKKLSETLTNIGSRLADVKGFVSASVKWRPKGKFLVNDSPSPRLLGEKVPDYPVAGEPKLAQAVAAAADATGLWAETTEDWGLDPSQWQPLSILRPEGKISVVSLSLSQMSPEAHRKWGIALRKGAQKWPEPLALIVSGSLSFRTDIGDELSSQSPLVEKFDQEVVRIFTKGEPGQLDEMDRNLFAQAQPEGGLGSLYFLWGALGEKTTGALEFYARPLPGMASALLFFSV